MAITYPDPNDVSQTVVDRLVDLFEAAWQSRDPDVNLNQGALRTLVLQPQALLAAMQEEAVLREIASSSLTGIAANPDLADAAAVNRVLGNFGLVRRSGVAATGQITIVVANLKPVILPGGSRFTCGGVAFTTDATYAARTAESQVISATDRLLVAVTGGYGFNVQVTAENVGIAGNVVQGTAAEPSITITGLVRAHVAADFSGGIDEETNAQLVARQQQGLAAKAWGGRENIEASTANAFQLLAASIIGGSQAEMRRDKQSVWPVGTGMRADFWLRTSTACETTMVQKTATLVSKVGAVGTWQFALGRDDAPGFYEVQKILLPVADQAGSGFAPSSTTRGTDLGTDTWSPAMPRALDSAFSRYQTAVVQFADTVTDATALTVSSATASYNVYVRRQPLIKDIQDFWADLDRRPPAGDLLIRAAIPCLVTVTAAFTYPAGAAAASLADVKAAISTAVNGVSFAGNLPASIISQAIHTAAPSALAVTSIAMTGRLIKPSGAVVNLSSSSALAIADDFDTMTSGSTVAFFLATSDVTLTATAV